MKKFLSKITILVCMTMFESYGSESDDDSDSNRSDYASSLCSVLSKLNRSCRIRSFDTL